MDCFTPEFRSDVMARIRSSGTGPEERLAVAVRASLGPRPLLERNVAILPGRPDIVIPSLKLCIFADGCFFHGCPRHWRAPLTRPEYWVPKVEGNVRRDRRTAAALRRQGYSVWRVWEHDLRAGSIAQTASRLAAKIERRRTQIASSV
jgi:DNA mismatch endonuclease (patch repair protein)